MEVDASAVNVNDQGSVNLLVVLAQSSSHDDAKYLLSQLNTSLGQIGEHIAAFKADMIAAVHAHVLEKTVVINSLIRFGRSIEIMSHFFCSYMLNNQFNLLWKRFEKLFISPNFEFFYSGKNKIIGLNFFFNIKKIKKYIKIYDFMIFLTFQAVLITATQKLTWKINPKKLKNKFFQKQLLDMSSKCWAAAKPSRSEQKIWTAELAGQNIDGRPNVRPTTRTDGHFGGQTKSAKRKIFKYYIQISKL
ncbi:hypothetical protein BpHYR1_054494 [Brachionus plicatilis]|uniref:Uncharacterized protein n=1 Tax=Brachionus plicatilis TaxID=10195 RepID=A0A3M7S883_BRAPC|nr:hypothetical protein BpHYR1_054494 [Brachionus plicatilis]